MVSHFLKLSKWFTLKFAWKNLLGAQNASSRFNFHFVSAQHKL